MKIDYSLPQYSKYMLHLDANVHWGIKHIQVAMSEAPVSLLERIGQVALGVLMMLPALGHLCAAIDYAVNGRISTIHLKETDPYRRGFEYGAQLKSETQFLYECVKGKIREKSAGNPAEFNRAVEQLKRGIPQHLHEEMRGLSAGAGVSLEDVYKIHTFLDIYAGIYGCSAVASVKENGRAHYVVKTNHFEGDPVYCPRFLKLQFHGDFDGVTGHQNALKMANVDDTMQSVVFDINNREIHFSSAWQNAADKIFSLFSVFKKHKDTNNPKQVFAAYNLDWPWAVASPYVRPVTFKSADGKKKFVNLTFPGYLGVLRGMNEHGVTVGCCQSGNSKQENGMPVTLLFRDLLENSSNAAEAERRLALLRPASSMNIVVAGPDGAFVAEIDPARAQTGAALIKRA